MDNHNSYESLPTVKTQKKCMICDNEDDCIDFGSFRRSQYLYHLTLVEKKTPFSMKLYSLKVTSQLKSDDKFFEHCSLKIQNMKSVL